MTRRGLRNRLSILLAAFATLAPSALLAQAITDAERESIDALFAEWDRWDSPGASLAVVRDGETIYARGYGSANLEYRIPITAQTPFHVASVSKQFTDFTVVLLEQQGKLSLDDPIQKHVPEVPDFGATITLRHLAHHTSGLRDQWELLAMGGWRLDDVITKEHVLKMVERQRELNFPPNTEYTYCNTGYTLLAEAVARSVQRSFPELAQDLIFEPLGMSRTHFHDDHEHLVPGRAYSYQRRGDGFAKSVLSYANVGATSLFTTAEDLARWLIQLDRGTVGGPEALAAMHRRGVLESGKEIDYALGLSWGESRGLPWVGHSGGDAGFRSMTLRFPEQGVGVVVLSNLAQFDAGRQAIEVAEVLLEGQMEKKKDEAASEPGVELSPAALDRFVGRWVTDLGVVTLTRRGSRLIAEAPGQEPTAMKALGEREFLIEPLAARVSFELTDGVPTSFTVTLPGQQLTGKRVDPVSADSLAELVGDYFSPELDTHYQIVLEDGELIARHQRHSDIRLTALGENELAGDQWFFSRLRFERDEAGAIQGMRVNGGRVRNLWFVRR